MKPMLLFLPAFLFLQTSAQTIKLENLTYGKKESRVVFTGENYFRLISKEAVGGFQYDKSLADIELRNDSLIIHVFHSVKFPERKSNREGKNDELKVAFLMKTGDRINTVFPYKKLPYAFASIGAQPERAKVDKTSILNSKKVEISVTGTDTESFFANYKVQQFQLSIKDKTFQITGNQLSEEALSAIALAQSGDTLTLRNIDSFDDVAQKKLRFGPTLYFVK
jgi:hypothetical protein